ncbi:sulfurtransferase [Conexibacter stalactiti]|uniref:Sulfurtransferase n=1 Tax=Conexibacter stalactiti TaxID=1940611 RepID=A0ABU4HIS9_9ACTN|nr:sulfurtransferase [Conexibacter stalactiti]MDW5593229.1 sulfurtransferase [Conexibacter stalactiti]MEC5033870.1 sulfurtransferase [Conexibacter stalactiti]
MDPLISQEWLAARLEEPRLRIVDCRFTLGDPAAGRAAYERGHIPGAAFLDLDADLSSPPATPDPAGPRRGPLGGRHPLPDLDRFAASVRRAGIGSGTTVVAYDDAMSGGAARLWWLLRHCGFDDAAVLEGGLAAWEGPLRTGGEPPRAAGDFKPSRVRDDVVTAEQIAADVAKPPQERELLLLDARAPERFRGEVEPVDPVAGHIPGARNVPLASAFPPPADPAALIGIGTGDDARARTLVASCGSGVTATGLVLALTAAGRDDVKLYAGSWSDWVARGLPVESGDVPNGISG